MIPSSILQAASALQEATALVITAGAGMGVDSGLPDFRGTEGFWRAYPPYAALGRSFQDIADPALFREDPELVWGFYGHRLHLYRNTVPHPGFEVLRTWASRMRDGHRVFTSNVDGQFQKAGFSSDSIEECHGSIHHLQCTSDCGIGIYDATGVDVQVDADTFRAKSPLPVCPRCHSLARPNVLMFGDWKWNPSRTLAQKASYDLWQHNVFAKQDARVVVVECGAGLALPSVRNYSELLVLRRNATLIRINVRDTEVLPGQIAIGLGAKAALLEIDEAMSRGACTGYQRTAL